MPSYKVEVNDFKHNGEAIQKGASVTMTESEAKPLIAKGSISALPANPPNPNRS